MLSCSTESNSSQFVRFVGFRWAKLLNEDAKLQSTSRRLVVASDRAFANTRFRHRVRAGEAAAAFESYQRLRLSAWRREQGTARIDS